MKTFIKSTVSRDLALKCLKAVSTEDVNRILESTEEFADRSNWINYGGVEKNWDRVNVQTSNAVGALAELIINSIDAILMRKAKESRVSENDSNCPRNMREAVARFFPEVTEGRLLNIEPRRRTTLAEKCVLVGVRRIRKNHIYPTYTIIDYGEGQRPKDFPKTLLSLGEKNKEGIPYVQGRFNMGSTGSIVFCTQGDIRKSHYKFVLSRRNTRDENDGPWGWTLIRVRKAAQGEVLPVTEYFAPNREIPSFETEEIQSLCHNKIGLIKGGTVVKLYEYDIGTGSRAVDFGLRHALATSLVECALPIRIYDFDSKPDKKRGELRSQGIADSTFAGLPITLHSTGDDVDENGEPASGKEGEREANKLAFNEMIASNSENPDLGRIQISGFGLWKMPEYLKNHRNKHRVFYTINGQSQTSERASFYRNAKLDDLRNHLVVQVNCDKMDPTARSAIFKPDRERKSDTELTRTLEKIVIQSLKESGKLREFAAEIRRRRVVENIEKDEQSRDFFEQIVRDSPDLKELLGLGDQISLPTVAPGVEKYRGKYFPTYLRPMDRRLRQGEIKEIPINTYRRIVCETDVRNDYLSRAKDRGEVMCPAPDIIKNRNSLRDGKLTITVTPPEGAQVDQLITAYFGFTDSNCLHNPLGFNLNIKIVSPEEKEKQDSGRHHRDRQSRPAFNFPQIRWVTKEEWSEHNFDEMSGAAINTSEEGYTIYVNKDNKYLKAVLYREPDESKRTQYEHWFKYGVGIRTFSIYRKMNPDRDAKTEEGITLTDHAPSRDYDSDQAYQDASSAIAAHIVTIIKQLGRHNK